jgi:phosphoglycolate phosphatase
MGHLHRRLIAFDLDGTLIDSSRDLTNSVNELLGEHGAPALPIERVMKMIGEGAKVLIRRALAAAGIAEDPVAIARFLQIYDRRLLEHPQPYAGIIDVIRGAREHARVSVLTNKPGAPTEKILTGLGIRDLFDDVVGSDGEFPRKPNPAGLLALMHRARATPPRTLMVGDSRIDYETARNAAACCCVVAYGFTDCAHYPESVPDAWVARDPSSLAEVIARFVTSD